MQYERPTIVDLGSIADHTFDTPPGPGGGGGDNKGALNCRIETTNCELSHPGS
ncbi:MAG TPA: hypothetical protein VE915_05770 [Actinomycetota bacterium]|jgi:hypothetical protein|nr:hypothetical protein [Actinomycetota bacterium]